MVYSRKFFLYERNAFYRQYVIFFLSDITVRICASRNFLGCQTPQSGPVTNSRWLTRDTTQMFIYLIRNITSHHSFLHPLLSLFVVMFVRSTPNNQHQKSLPSGRVDPKPAQVDVHHPTAVKAIKFMMASAVKPKAQRPKRNHSIKFPRGEDTFHLLFPDAAAFKISDRVEESRVDSVRTHRRRFNTRKPRYSSA